MASPTHYANIVDPTFTRIGIGVVYGADGRQYTVQRYLAPPGGGAAVEAVAPPAGARPGVVRRAAPPVAVRPAAGRAPTTTTTTEPPPPPEPPGPGDPAHAAVVLDALQRYER